MSTMIRRSWVIPALAAAGALLVVTAGAMAAVETDTVANLGRGLWWSLALMTTVGFLGDPPQTVAGAWLSAALMTSGFFLLALVSAGLASLFVREDEQEVEVRESAEIQVLVDEIRSLRTEVAGMRADLVSRGPGRDPERATA
jgi:voltage-gated potassium channel